MQKTTRKIEEMNKMYGIYDDLYTMNRNVKEHGDLRYDITEIPACKINGQFIKTKGHIHSSGHKEVYTVLDGTAFFLFQKGTEKVEDFYYVQASRGEHVVVPGDYHHVTVNAGIKTLILGNWISKKCVSDYSLMEKMNGMCYYLGNEWKKNPKYKNMPKKRIEYSLSKLPEDLTFL